MRKINQFINHIFKEGMKIGLWEHYHWETKKLESVGKYKNDKRRGLWKHYYQETGELREVNKEY